MKKQNVFARISYQLEKHLNRMLNKLYTMQEELNKLDEDIAEASGPKQVALKAKKASRYDKYTKEVKKYNLLYSMKAAVCFLEGFYGSFKYRWVPVALTAVLVMGSFKSVTAFVVGTLVNTFLVFGVLTFVMYGMCIRGSVEKYDRENQSHMLIAKGIFLALAVVKVLYTLLGPGLMIAAVVVLAIAVALWIERDDLKLLFKRWTGKYDKDDSEQSDEDEE